MIKLIFEAFRDLSIRFLPNKIVKQIIPECDFVFLVHPLDISYATKKYPFMKNIPPFIIRFLARHLWPITGARITGLKKKNGKGALGWIVICPMFAKQMMQGQESAKKRVLQSVTLAEKLGAKLVGLGGFNSIVTDGGFSLAGKVKIGLTTGNVYAAALVIQNIIKIADIIGVDTNRYTVAVVGAGGSVGSACSKVLSKRFNRVLLVDRNPESLNKIYIEIKSLKEEVVSSLDIKIIKDADFIVTVTSTAEGIVKPQHLKPGSIIIDAAQPYNVCKEVLEEREDVLVINSGIAVASGIDCHFDTGLPKEEIYACLGEVMMLTWKGWQGNYSLGWVDPNLVEEIIDISKQIGFYVADFRNSLGFITREHLNRIQKHYLNKGRQNVLSIKPICNT